MHSSLFTAAFLYRLGIGAAALSLSPPRVTIPSGTLQGGRCNGTSDAIYYKAIPYAQPPVGPLRFAPPQPYSHQYPGGFLVANASPPACIQFGAIFAETGPTSEDCLFINIWAPATATKTSSLPVKVWIHGGSQTAGGIMKPLYDGCNVAKDNALLVSVSYRLGPLGFLALQSAGIGGNQAIQDLLLGLEWVQANIAAFGGDPRKVLLHGESAGATNTYIIATLPNAPRLMNAAIAESGGGKDLPLNTTVQTLGANYTQSLSCSLTDATCLQSKSPSDLISAFRNSILLKTGLGHDGEIGVANINTLQFSPYVDGNVIPSQPSTEGVRVPTVFGSNADEGRLFTLAQYIDVSGNPAAATAEDYQAFLASNFGPAAALVQTYYPLSLFNATPYPPFFAISKVITDATFKCTSYRGLNRAVEKGIPVWTYLFSHTPSCTWDSSLPQAALALAGATHSAEIQFVFGNLANVSSSAGTCSFSGDEKAISATMAASWTAMALNKSPSTKNLTWPAYTNSSSSLGVNIVSAVTPGSVDYSVCALWDVVTEMMRNISNGSA